MDLALLRRDAGDLPACMHGKAGRRADQFSWVQLCRRQEQRSCGTLLFTADYTDFVSMSCFPCKAALLNLASPSLGLCLSTKGPLAEPCSCQSFFSVYLVTDLPHCSLACDSPVTGQIPVCTEICFCALFSRPLFYLSLCICPIPCCPYHSG
jgi:hypothetical protein